MKNAMRRGTKLILIDPRTTELSRQATHHVAFKPGSDVPMLNAIMHTIIEEGLTDPTFIAERTEGFEAMKEHLKTYTPEMMSSVCGVPAETLKEVARLYATSKGSMILWEWGSLNMSTGQIMRAV